jgi:mevalonate kinase
MSRAPALGEEVSFGRASGKIIVMGEHAVVWGAPALAAGVERGLLARARRTRGEAPSRLRLASESHRADPHGDERVGRAWAALLGADADAGSLAAELSGDLPAGMGLGFSAAAGVALARAVERCLGHEPSDVVVEQRAMAWEQVFHGNPSGIDVAAAMRGGMLRFSRVEGLRTLTAPRPLELCVGLTGRASATHEMVARVAAVREQARARFERTLLNLAAMTEQAIAATEHADGALLGALMDRAQDELASWSVSSGEIEELCQAARAAGALGAKLTGAGGGGTVIALVGFGEPHDRSLPTAHGLGERILAAWRAKGYEGFAARVGATPTPGRAVPAVDGALGAGDDRAPGR